MKLTLDPMPALRAAKIAEVNARFNALALDNSHRDRAHAQKREWATTNDPRLKSEADLRGLSVAELSSLILSKPDALAARELERQRSLLAIEAAKTPAELSEC